MSKAFSGSRWYEAHGGGPKTHLRRSCPYCKLYQAGCPLPFRRLAPTRLVKALRAKFGEGPRRFKLAEHRRPTVVRYGALYVPS